MSCNIISKLKYHGNGLLYYLIEEFSIKNKVKEIFYL